MFISLLYSTEQQIKNNSNFQSIFNYFIDCLELQPDSSDSEIDYSPPSSTARRSLGPLLTAPNLSVTNSPTGAGFERYYKYLYLYYKYLYLSLYNYLYAISVHL